MAGVSPGTCWASLFQRPCHEELSALFANWIRKRRWRKKKSGHIRQQQCSQNKYLKVFTSCFGIGRYILPLTFFCTSFKIQDTYWVIRYLSRFFDCWAHETTCMHILEISISSLNYVNVRPTKTPKLANKTFAQFY